MKYHNITKDDMLNGDGLRTVLWVSGCNHHCVGCQNPMTWDHNDGLVFDDAAKKEIFDQLDQNYIAGVTLSGGDPLHPANYAEIKQLIDEIKEHYPNKPVLHCGDYEQENYLSGGGSHQEQVRDMKRENARLQCAKRRHCR